MSAESLPDSGVEILAPGGVFDIATLAPDDFALTLDGDVVARFDAANLRRLADRAYARLGDAFFRTRGAQ